MSQDQTPPVTYPPTRVAQYVRMSTDHQRYSIENQTTLIQAYADSNGMEIVQTYADPGKSGLTIKDRPGLARLLADVVSRDVRFQAVLVYDVSRWGRFQDADESAHYEFLCRQAGVRVIYCAEQFVSDGTPFASVLKAMKRAMAGEYSRELGVKVATGKARIGSLGFRVGGIAGYGLRRQVLEDGQTPGLVLRDRQRKSIQTDRVRLVPGPMEEILVIHRIYRDYIYLRKSERQISSDLNSDGLSCFGRRWSRALVRTILSNEKYVGNNIVGKFSSRLRTRQIIKSPEKWTRCEGAFEPIVPQAMFNAAERVRRFNEKTSRSSEDLIEALAVVLQREGKLTTAIINRAPDLPSANTVHLRFGTLGQAYEKLGFKPASRYGYHAVNRALRSVKRDSEQQLLHALWVLGITTYRSDTGLIVVSTQCTVEVLACRFKQPRTYQRGWRIAYCRNLGASTIVAVRLNPANECVCDILVVPRTALLEIPVFIRVDDERLVTRYRHTTMTSAANAIAVASRGF